MDPTLALVAALILATHFIGAIASYGSALLALPLLLLVWPDRQALVLCLVAIGLVQSVQIVLANRRHVEWPTLGRMLLWAGLGMPAGVAMATWLPERGLMTALGLVLVVAALSRLGRPATTAAALPPWARHGLNGLLLTGGVIHGAFGTGGATVAVFAQYSFARKEGFRATLAMFWGLLNVAMITTLSLQGHFTAPVGLLVLIGLPCVLLGSYLGERVAARVQPQQFAAVVAVLLLISGAVTLTNTWWPAG